jgi:hypothetical protein
VSPIVGRIDAVGRVAVDTTCPRYFHQAALLTELISYVSGAVAIDSVLTELDRQGRSRQDFAAILARTRWPARLRYELTPSEQADAFRIQREWVADDRRRDPTFQSTKDTHLGEIEMVIAASRAGIGAVILDDRRGRQLAGARGLVATSTGGLAIEMAAVGHLARDQAFTVYAAAYGDPSRAEFERLVDEYRP